MSKLNMMICPHDTAKNPEKWFRFIQYLNHHLTFTVHLNISLDFKDFHDHFTEADIIYANPTDGLKLVKEHQFSPLVRSTNLYDEVVFIANPNLANPSLQSYQGAKVATVISMIASKIATSILERQGIIPDELVNKDSWLGVINTVAKDEVHLGLVYKDTYDELAPKTKEMVKQIAVSSAKSVFHGIYLSPTAQIHAQEVASVLIQMHLDQTGLEVLQELKIDAWEMITDNTMQAMLQIAG